MKLAVILEYRKFGPDEAGAQAWSNFSKSANKLEQALNKTKVKAGNDEERGPNAINFEMVSDIQYSLTRIQKQLDRLDRNFQWRDYMNQKKERVMGK